MVRRSVWHLAVEPFTARDAAMAENHDFCLHHLHSILPLNGPRRNIAITFGVEILERMVWLPDGEKNSADKFTHFDRVHERDGQTDGQPDTA